MNNSKERMNLFCEIAKHFEFDEDGGLVNSNIQYNDRDFDIWEQSSADSPKTIYDNIMVHGYKYRLKPQPEYVPFEEWEEVFENAYNPEVIWVKYKKSNRKYSLSGMCDTEISIHGNWYSFIDAFSSIVFFNPLTKETKPFGKLKNV